MLETYFCVLLKQLYNISVEKTGVVLDVSAFSYILAVVYSIFGVRYFHAIFVFEQQSEIQSEIPPGNNVVPGVVFEEWFFAVKYKQTKLVFLFEWFDFDFDFKKIYQKKNMILLRNFFRRD